MTKRVIIMNFEQASLAYQAFSETKKLYNQQQIKGEEMAVLTHQNDDKHPFVVEDFIDFTGKNHTITDSWIGMIIGILAGPLGILLGWLAGGLVGAKRDAKEIQEAKNIFEHVTKQIVESKTGLILIADEEDNRPLNHLVIEELGGEITRLDFDQVEKEISDAKEVEKEAKKSTEKLWKSKRDKIQTNTEK